MTPAVPEIGHSGFYSSTMPKRISSIGNLMLEETLTLQDAKIKSQILHVKVHDYKG